jgi:predicted esterase
MVTNPDDPHLGQSVLTEGAPIGEASAAMIMIHGRGADAADIIGLAQLFERPDIAYLAPEAAGHVWYPNRFLAPRDSNEPWLSSALAVIARLVAAAGVAGTPPERVAILGFSQGACLALEFAARHPRRYAGVFALTGGLIGEGIDPAAYAGSLEGTPVFIGSSDRDPHIPLARVRESSAVMTALGAALTERIYPGMGHTIVEDEIAHIRRILAESVPPPAA